MKEELDYAEMLEIPVSTVNVVKKKSIFKRKNSQPDREENLKDMVVESVNERAGAYVAAEDLTDIPKPQKGVTKTKPDKASIVLISETVAVAIFALAIFLTNVFLPTSAINTFLSSFYKTSENVPTYSEFTLTSIVGDFSDTEISISNSGVMSFKGEECVYPVCDGTVSKVYENGGLYTVEIEHSTSFTSVVTGLSSVYSEVGEAVAANLPMGYTNGENEVKVSLYNGGELLSCVALNGESPVWVS
jgi:hypothetical protein